MINRKKEHDFVLGTFAGYGEPIFTASRYTVKQRKDLRELLPDRFCPETICEFGCADGENVKYFATEFSVDSGSLTGVDLCAPFDQAPRGFRFVHQSVEAFLEENCEKFDLIILSDVLEHIYNPWQVLKKIKSSLSIRGRLLISVPNGQNVNYLRAMASGAFNYQATGLFDETHIRFFSKETLVSYLEEAGLIAERIGFRPDGSMSRLRESILSSARTEMSVNLNLGSLSIIVNLRDIDLYLGQQILICARHMEF